MNVVQERLRRATVTVTSPDRTVRASWNVETGVSIELRHTDRHTEESLSKQLTAAARGVVIGRRRALTTVARKDRDQAVYADTDERERRDLAGVDVETASRTGGVTVRWRGARDIAVRVAAGALGRRDARTLAVEIEDVLTEAVTAHGRAHWECVRDSGRFDALRKAVDAL